MKKINKSSTSLLTKLLPISVAFLIVLTILGYALRYENLQKYGDFFAFYKAAKMFEGGAGNILYSVTEQSVWQKEVFTKFSIEMIDLAYLNPPFALIPLLPLTAFNPFEAYEFWITLLTGILMLIALLILIIFNHENLTKKILALFIGIAFFPTIFSLLIGQWGIILFLCLLLSWFFYKSDKDFLAGFIFSLVLIKPHLIILPLIVFILSKERRLLSGIAMGSFLLLVLSFLMVGSAGMSGYINLLINASSWSNEYGTDINMQHTIQTSLMLIGGIDNPLKIRFIWIFLSSLFAIITIFSWEKRFKKGSLQSNLQWVLLILAIILLSPHTHLHDLSILSVVNLILFYSIKQMPTKGTRTAILLISASFLLYICGNILVENLIISQFIFVVISVFFLIVNFFTVLFLLFKAPRKTLKNA